MEDAMLAVQEKEPPYFTYKDYLRWDESERAELVDGEVYMMAAPSAEHQRLLMEIAFQLKAFLRGKRCQVFPAPFAVRLHPLPDKKDDTVFEPDIVVVCDPSKIDEKGCNGAPDLVVEIISPSSAARDRVLKFRRYLQAGIREYWLVDPEDKTVQVCLLEDGRYVLSAYNEEDVAPVAALPGCEVDLRAVFAPPPAVRP